MESFPASDHDLLMIYYVLCRAICFMMYSGALYDLLMIYLYDLLMIYL